MVATRDICGNDQALKTTDAVIHASMQFGSGTPQSVLVEGTFTPVLQGSVVAGSPSYIRQIASYRRENNRVWVYINVAWNGTSGMSGSLLIAGLPFTSRNTAGLISTFVSAVGTDSVAMTFASQYVPMFVLSPNITQIAITAMDGAAGGFSPFGIQNGSVAIQGYYYI